MRLHRYPWKKKLQLHPYFQRHNQTDRLYYQILLSKQLQDYQSSETIKYARICFVINLQLLTTQEKLKPSCFTEDLAEMKRAEGNRGGKFVLWEFSLLWKITPIMRFSTRIV